MNVLADIFLPRGASNLATDVDMAWNVILWTTTFFFVVVVGAMTFFVIRYRRRTPNDATSEITHNTPLEIAWTVIPLIIVIIFFFVGFKGFLNYDNPPSDAVTVDVTGQQWAFSFAYPNGATDSNLYVEAGKPVRLSMHSNDVLHALYLPEFRTQRNLVPGRQTQIWFIPDADVPASHVMPEEGWPIFCTQYCGDGHSRMMAHVFVLASDEFNKKMAELANPFKKKDPKTGKTHWVPYVALGETLYHQIGCASCHSIDAAGTVGTGPPWHGLYKRDHEPFAASNEPGYTLKASDPDEKWDAYLNESILNPDAKLVTYGGKAFHGMPNFASQLSGINDEKRYALIDFIKSLGNTGWKPDINPTDNPDLYDADNPKLFDENHNPVHPESKAGIKARQALASQPGK